MKRVILLLGACLAGCPFDRPTQASWTLTLDVLTTPAKSIFFHAAVSETGDAVTVDRIGDVVSDFSNLRQALTARYAPSTRDFVDLSGSIRTDERDFALSSLRLVALDAEGTMFGAETQLDADKVRVTIVLGLRDYTPSADSDADTGVPEGTISPTGVVTATGTSGATLATGSTGSSGSGLVACFDPSETLMVPDHELYVDAGCSVGITDYEAIDWDFDNDGTIDAHGQDFNWHYSAPGTYTIRMVAHGAGGATAETTRIVEVTPARALTVTAGTGISVIETKPGHQIRCGLGFTQCTGAYPQGVTVTVGISKSGGGAIDASACDATATIFGVIYCQLTMNGDRTLAP